MSNFASLRGTSSVSGGATPSGPSLHPRSPLDAPSPSLRPASLQQPYHATSRRTSTQAAASGSGMRQLPSPSSSSTPSTPAPAPATSATTPPTPTTPTARPNYRVSFFDAMKFNGPAPELINGRLAMVGLMQAAMQESEGGQTVLDQLSHISLGTCLVIGVWVYASMVPLLKGVKQEAFGPFSPRAELTNGRAAMLGFAALCALESSAGVPFF